MFATDKRGQRVNLNLIESGHYAAYSFSASEGNTLFIALEINGRWLVETGEFGTYRETLDGVRELAKQRLAETKK